MKFHKRNIAALAIALSGILNGSLQAQTDTISGVVNHYTRVVWSDCNSILVVQDGFAFQANDRVMLIQMKGVAMLVPTAPADTLYQDFGHVSYNNNAGNYELATVESVQRTQSQRNRWVITLKKKLVRSYDFQNPLAMIQLVRVPHYTNVIVRDSVCPLPWNNAKGIGGVLAIEADSVVKLNGKAEASGMGFQGGQRSEPYTGLNGGFFARWFPPSLSNDTVTWMVGRGGYKGKNGLT